MGEFLGTKGIWKVKHSESKSSVNVIGTSLGGRYKIARCPYTLIDGLTELNDTEKNEATANALLISKAPEILEMLNDHRKRISELSSLIDSQYNIWSHHRQMFNDLIIESENMIKSATEL